MGRRIFVTGGTGYLGSRLVLLLVGRGHQVAALVRPGSERKPLAACTPIVGDALDGASYEQHLAGCDTFIQPVGVAHPSPAKAKEFVAVDERSGLAPIHAAQRGKAAGTLFM